MSLQDLLGSSWSLKAILLRKGERGREALDALHGGSEGPEMGLLNAPAVCSRD